MCPTGRVRTSQRLVVGDALRGLFEDFLEPGVADTGNGYIIFGHGPRHELACRQSWGLSVWQGLGLQGC